MAYSGGYTPDLGAIICDKISQGQSLRSICAGDKMPAPSTVCLWLTQRADFAEQYARAREAQADRLAEQTLEIADAATAEDHQVARLRVDARKWFASKVAPKKYGDKLEQHHTGEMQFTVLTGVPRANG